MSKPELQQGVSAFLLAMKDCGYTASDLREAFAPYADALLRPSPAAAAGVPTEASLDNFDSAVAILNDFESAVQALSGELWKQEWQDAYDAAKTALISALTRPTPAAGVPTGWKLVPSKVTEDMHVAACKVLMRAHGLDGTPQRMLDAMLVASPVAPVGAPTRLTDEQIVKIAVQTFGKYAYEARSLFIQYANELLSVRQGCELATDATKQLGAQARMPTDADLEQWANSWNASAGEFIEHLLREFCKSNSIHLAATPIDQDFRRRPASSEAAPSAQGSVCSQGCPSTDVCKATKSGLAECARKSVVAHPDTADALRYRWLRENVDETPVRPAAYGAVNFPDMRLKFVLPDMLSFADYMGQRTFDEAVDAAIARCGDGSPLGSGARPDQPKLPESGGGSSIGLGAEGEQ